MKQAQIARMARRVENLGAQRPALQQSMAEYGDDFDLEIWTKTWISGDPDDINRALALTGGFASIVNNLVELMRSGATIAGLLPGKRPRAEAVIDTVKDDGGISGKQARHLHELYKTRGRLQHASPDITAEEVHEYVTLLDAEFAGLFKAVLGWLAKHGTEFK